MHLLPLQTVLSLDDGQQTVEKEGIYDGLEIDLVTHDAAKFLGLMLKRNGYVLEQLLSPLVVLTRGWRMKEWTTKKGKTIGGGEFNKNKVTAALTNATYIGMIEYEGQLHPGLQEAIIKRDVFDRVQETLKQNSRMKKDLNRCKHNALLPGLLRCLQLWNDPFVHEERLDSLSLLRVSQGSKARLGKLPITISTSR